MFIDNNLKLTAVNRYCISKAFYTNKYIQYFEV